MSANSLHKEAMTIVQDAIVLGEKLASMRRKAYLLERSAAMMLIDNHDKEPTRSVLFRGAAWLAHNCGEFADGAVLAEIGMLGNNCPIEINQELAQVRQACIDNFPKK